MSMVAVGIGAAVVVGGGAIIAGSSGAGNVSKPPVPNIGTTAQNTVDSMGGTAQQQLNLNQIYDPQYASLYGNILNSNLLGGINSQAFLQGNPDAMAWYQGDLKNGDGRTADQWVQDYIKGTGVNPSTVPRSGGLLQTYSQAAPQLQNLQNTLNIQASAGNVANMTANGGNAIAAINAADPQRAALQAQMNQNALNPQQVQALAPSTVNPLDSLASWGDPRMNVQAQQVQSRDISALMTQAPTVTANAISPTDFTSVFNTSPFTSSQLNVNPTSVNFQNQNPLSVNSSGDNTLGALNQSALSQLNLGGQLGQNERDQIANNTLSYFNTFGRGQDPAAAATLALNMDQAQQQRLQQRQQMAGSVAGLNQGQNAQNIQAQGLNQSALLQSQGMGLNAATTNANMYQQAQLANQSAQLQQQQNYLQGTETQAAQNLSAAQSNQGTFLNASNYNAGYNLQSQVANQDTNYKTQYANQQSALEAALANQQASLQANLANQNAFLQQQGMTLQGASTYAGLSQQGQDLYSQLHQQAQQQNITNQYNSLGQAYGSAMGTDAMGLGLLGNSNAYGMAANALGQSSSIPTTGNFDPYAISGQLYNTYQNNYANAQMGSAANNMALIGGGLGILGGVAGGAMKACWVAREVYGEDNPKWLTARTWMLTKAPSKLRSLYLENGERLASVLSGIPTLKIQIKKAFDSILETEMNHA